MKKFIQVIKDKKGNIVEWIMVNKILALVCAVTLALVATAITGKLTEIITTVNGW
jgi:hypothetical protein